MTSIRPLPWRCQRCSRSSRRAVFMWCRWWAAGDRPKFVPGLLASPAAEKAAWPTALYKCGHLKPKMLRSIAETRTSRHLRGSMPALGVKRTYVGFATNKGRCLLLALGARDAAQQQIEQIQKCLSAPCFFALGPLLAQAVSVSKRPAKRFLLNFTRTRSFIISTEIKGRAWSERNQGAWPLQTEVTPKFARQLLRSA